MAYRQQDLHCFDGDTDMHYYRLMQAWRITKITTFNFHMHTI